MPVELGPFLVGGLAGNQGRVDYPGDAFELLDVLPDDQHVVFAVFLEDLIEDFIFAAVSRGQPVLDPVVFFQDIFHTLAGREFGPYLETFGGGNPALGFQFFPGHVVFLGTNQ